VRITWIYGPPAAGKSVTGWRLFETLAAAGNPVAYVDVDQLGICFPEHDDDPGRIRLKARALAALAAVRRSQGCRHLVVSGVTDLALREWQDALLADFDVRWCRLTAPGDHLESRLAARGAWGADPQEVRAEAAALDTAAPRDPVVTTGDGRTVAQVADEVARLTAEPGPGQAVDLAVVGTDLDAGLAVEADRDRGGASAIWLNGTTAVGRSVVGWELFVRSVGDGGAAFLDAQQLGFAAHLDLAAAGTTRGSEAGEAGVAASTGVAAVWPVLRSTGVATLVVSGTRVPGPVPPVELLAPTPVHVVRLEASAADLAERVAARARGEGVRLAGDDLLEQGPDEMAETVARAVVLQRDLREAPSGRPVDTVVDTTGRTPSDVADEVRRRTAVGAASA
jgi:hypothetical protein